jgi:hypothetical protein
VSQIFICGVDVRPCFTYIVIATPEHRVLERYTHSTLTLTTSLPALLEEWQERDTRIVVTGRVEACWPEELLNELFHRGMDIHLIGGPPVRRLVRLERRLRENQTYRTASLLTALCSVRGLAAPSEQRRSIYQWCLKQAHHHIDDLHAEMACDYIPEWAAREGGARLSLVHGPRPT